MFLSFVFLYFLYYIFCKHLKNSLNPEIKGKTRAIQNSDSFNIGMMSCSVQGLRPWFEVPTVC